MDLFDMLYENVPQEHKSEKVDWRGDKNSVFKTLGASNHTKKVRQGADYYATEPLATKLLLELETFDKNIWEVCCGEGHISKVLEQSGYNVLSTDLIDRDFGKGGVNFLQCTEKWNGDIITNPPYSMAKEFVEKSMELINDGNKVAMFLKVLFLEGKARKKLFEKYPPKRVWVSSSRLLCAKNGDFPKMTDGGGGSLAYCWYVWEKGFKGDPILKWFN